MKKIFSIIVALLLPFMIYAQHKDTTTIYFENFDGATQNVTTSTSCDTSGQGDWKITSNYYYSSPKCFYTPVYPQNALSAMYVKDVPLTSTTMTDAVRKVYVEFDHICKVSQLDQAYLYYAKASGLNFSGEPNYALAQRLSFTGATSWYLGSGTFDGIEGQFSDACYSIWNKNTMNATPNNNTWWKHEKFDISSFVVDGSSKYLKLEFRVTKSSPSSTGSEVCKGWFVDNVKIILSNCELIKPTITMQAPLYMQSSNNTINNNTLNNIGPYLVKAKLFDNDTIDTASVHFTYQIFPYQMSPEAVVNVPNTFTSNTFAAAGNTVQAEWEIPTICYLDTVRYHLYIEDSHGSNARFDTFFVARHNQTNIQNNDCRLDSLDKGAWPHCFISGTNQPVNLHFINKSDAAHSSQTGSVYQTNLSVNFKVQNESGQVTHNSTHTWNGSLCFDERDQLSLGTFQPTTGWNYITVCVNTRNGQVDGYHANDTLHYAWYSCDSLLKGDYTVGGTNPDFPNMKSVKDNLEYCGLGGPVTFHLRPGTYQDFDFQKNYEGQSAVNTITFTGDNRDNVIVVNNRQDSTVAAYYYGAVTLVDVKNYRFKNLTIQGKQQAVSRAVALRGNGSANVIFDNCKILANPTNTTTTTSYAVGRETAASNRADTVIFRNCIMDGGNFGVYYMGNTKSGNNSRQNNLTVENCRINSCYRGVYAKYSLPLTLKNNHITQYTLNSHLEFSGIYIEYAANTDIDGNTIDSVYNAEYGICAKNLNAEGFYIRNNHVKVGDSNFGIYLNASSSSTTDTGYVYNNEVILYPVLAGTSYAMQLDNANGLKLTNNSLYIKSNAPYSNTAALYIKNTTNNNTTYFNNNILINECNSSDNTNYALHLQNTSKVVGSYNNLYSVSSTIAYTTTPKTSIADFESAMTTCTNSISKLPPMADATNGLIPTDYTGMECPRNSKVMSDIRNTQRTALTYMGAYAAPIAATDASVVALLVPSVGDCPQNTYNVTVSVANKGSEALNFANHNAVITVHSDSLNLTQTRNITSGSVPVLGSSSQLVANNIAIPVNQQIDLTFIIRTNGDNNYVNDTLRIPFVMEVARPDYEEDFSNGTTQQTSWSCVPEGDNRGNWTFQSGTYGTPAIAPVYGTGTMFFNAKNTQYTASTKALAVMPVVQLNNAVNPILEMWFAHDNATGGKDVEGVTVKVSTNGGTSYTAIKPTGQTATLVKRYKQTATTPEWVRYEYDLGNYVSSGCIYIAFEAAASAQHGGDIHIDRVRLKNRYNNDIAVTQIYGQGETPTKFEMKDVVSALVYNEGSQAQTNVDVYLTVTGATETYRDTVTVPSLASNAQTIVKFPDHVYSVNEVKNVEVRSRNDQNNSNNAINWRMVTNNNVANYADTASFVQKTGDYSNVIRPCVRFKTNEELVVTDVKYYYDQSYIANPERGFKAFVSNAAGQVLATSELVNFDSLQQGAWNIIPIKNFALTNVQDEIYVGIEMLANGDYLCSQVETPLRDSAFYYLEADGSYTPQTFGRFMIGAVVDTPHIHDFAILNMLNPTTRCDLGHEHIKLTITNNGSHDILPGTQLHYSINGLPAVTETMADTLHSHETKTFTFNSIFDFTNHQININSNYNIVVWVSKDAQDRLQYNDTIRELVVSLGKSELPVVTDTVNISYYTSGVINASLPASISQGVIGWYTNTGYESWNFLGYGTSYTTPVTFFDTTYYVTANPGYIYNNVIGTGKGTSVNPNSVVADEKPFVFAAAYSVGRILYTQNEIGQYGPVSRIGFYVTTKATNANGFPVKIYLKQTQLNTLPTAQVDWANEILDATLIVDEQLTFEDTGWYYFNLSTPFDYTSGNLMVLTELYNGATSTGGPKFQSTSISSMVQYKNANALAQLTGNYTANGKRLNLSIQISDLQCGSEKVPVVVHVPDIPLYDVETISFDYPTTQCTLYEEHIKVTLKNNLNIPIPANKVVVHAIFNGQEITQLIAEQFESEEVKVVIFDTTFDFATYNHADEVFNYVVYTDMPTESVVYRGNDTITGSFTSKRTAQFPRNPIVYTGAYTQPYTVLEPADRPTNTNGTTEIIQWRYYADTNTTALTPTPTTANPTYTTGPLYDTTVIWVKAQTQSSTCWTHPTPIYINVRVPQYDLITNSLTSPASYQCDLTTPYQVKVNVGNTDTTASRNIPANTFNVTGRLVDGTHVVTDTKPVATAIPSQGNTVVTLSANNLVSTTQNYSYNYSIYSTPANSSMWTYTANDTITGMLYVPAKPTAPDTLRYTTPYGQTQTVTPSGMSSYYFYTSNSATAVPFAQGTSFTTENIYNNTTYYYSGRIESPDFEKTITAGTGTVNNAAPFTFGSQSGKSYAKILYNSTDLDGGVAGVIDTIYVEVATANTSGVAVPVKIWLKNGTDDATVATLTLTAWNTETTTASLIFDGDMEFGQTGWLAIPIEGGFKYNGQGLYMYLMHDCGTSSCANTMGFVAPTFKNTTYSNPNQRIVQLSGTLTSFTKSVNRWNTKFKFNYTCPSPKSPIYITTNKPQHDVGVVAITAPTSPDQYTNNETVTVTIKNFGSAAASNFPVSYRLGNGTPVTETYTASIAPGATGVKTFTQHADLTSAYFDTQFCAFTGQSGDAEHNNDTLCMLLNIGDPCISRPTNATGLDIANVKFAGIDNVAGAPASYTNYVPDGDGKYTDYTSTVLPGEIIKGQTYPMSITHAYTTATVTGNVYKSVYIDYNRDGEFTADESVYNSGLISSAAANATTTTTVTIPTTAMEGLTRMRVICSSNNVNSACATYSAGETEDYALRIMPPKDVDLGIVEIVHPNGKVCQDTAATVKVRVKNFGNQTQYFDPQDHPVTVNVAITGANAANYSGTVNSGSLLSGHDMLVSIPNVNLSALGSFNVKASLVYAGDQVAINDTMSASANTNSLGAIVSNINSFVDNFDNMTQLNPAYWASITGSDTANFKWRICTGNSPNSSTNYGPTHDHSQINTTVAQYGKYAMVEGKTGTSNYSKWTAMTTKCLNMHRQNEYPIELSMYKYFYAPAAATTANTSFKITIEVGSGNDFTLVDTLTFANNRNVTPNWERFVTTIKNFEAVGQLRFTMTDHKNKIDPAIDDINLAPGYPDLEVVEFAYPMNGYETVEGATYEVGECLLLGDSVTPVIVLKNNGFSPIVNYDVQITRSVAQNNWSDTIRDEHIMIPIPAGDTIHYKMSESFYIYHKRPSVVFRADAFVNLDIDTNNNYQTVVTCTNSDIEDYAEEKGVELGQNEPNPASSGTRIIYTLPDYGMANISVYSALGQLLYTQDQQSVKGENVMDLNVANWADGIYYYTLTYKDIVITKKMVVNK